MKILITKTFSIDKFFKASDEKKKKSQIQDTCALIFHFQPKIFANVIPRTKNF